MKNGMSVSKEYIEGVGKLWNEYILGGKDIGEVRDKLRPIIAKSWERSQHYNVSPTSTTDAQIDRKTLVRLQKENRDLIDISMPYLEQLYEYIRGTNCMIQLCDSNACVLKCLTNSDAVEKLSEVLSKQREGYLVSEEKIGTNSSGLCQKIKEPVLVFGEEHFQLRNHGFVCTSAPIFDDDNMIGILTLMCTKEHHQHHALGMVAIASDGIQKELSIKKSYNQLMLTNSILSSAIESLESGIILIDEQQKITLHNKNVLRTLKLPSDSLLGNKFYSYIKKNSIPADLQDLNTPVDNIELTLTNYLGIKANITLKITTIPDEHNNVKASLLSFTTQKQMHTLSNNVTGFHANYTFESIIGSSSAIKAVINMGKVAAQSDSPTLILGESGTGKELIAQSIHNASSRASGPFISINCGAIPKNLIANELFGSEYGAFTGARKNGNPGKFELANGGTLFLDEIGDMPFDLQVSLLGVLQNKEVTRLGGNFARKIDVRIIAATNKNLSESINTTFRADLYYRLNVLNITIPPLRSRIEDIPQLAEYFMAQYSKAMNKSLTDISERAMEKLMKYSWPGNVRELENAIERAVNITKSSTIAVKDLPKEITGSKRNTFAVPRVTPEISQLNTAPLHRENAHSLLPADEYITNSYAREEKNESSKIYDASISPETEEYKMLNMLLKQEHGHVKSVAKRSEIPLSTLYNKLKKYNLNPSEFRRW